ncbi:MAG: T9SS type A sorting domain-containing protein [Sphingobacteriales bacterium]|nr:T9SS type A sorting domain-containing protein [Sphingobacteriales bacterium]
MRIPKPIPIHPSDSTDGGHYIWDFGDGTPPLQTTTDAFIPHYYPNFGTYRVSLTAIVCNDTSTYTQTLNLWATGVSAPLNDHLFEVLPNPAQNYLVVSSQTSTTNATFVLYDVLGREVLSQHLSSNNTIVTEHLPAGVYLYQIINPQNQTLQHGKISIMH